MHVNYAPCFIDVPSGKTHMLSRIVMRILPETPSTSPTYPPPPANKPPHMSSFIVLFLDLCPDWHASMFDGRFRKLLWMYCPGHAGVKGDVTEQTDWLAKQPSRVVCISEDMGC